MGVREVQLRREKGRPRGVACEQIVRPHDVQGPRALLEDARRPDPVRRLCEYLVGTETETIEGSQIDERAVWRR